MFQDDIKKLAQENSNFRKVIYTGKHCQLVLMSIRPGEDIGEETHEGTDQILFLVDGEGEAVIDDQVSKYEEDDVVFVPAGTKHNFKNTSDEDMKLYTVYSPPSHKDGTIHITKQDALKDERDHYI